MRSFLWLLPLLLFEWRWWIPWPLLLRWWWCGLFERCEHGCKLTHVIILYGTISAVLYIRLKHTGRILDNCQHGGTRWSGCRCSLYLWSLVSSSCLSPYEKLSCTYVHDKFRGGKDHHHSTQRPTSSYKTSKIGSKWKVWSIDLVSIDLMCGWEPGGATMLRSAIFGLTCTYVHDNLSCTYVHDSVY